MHCHDTHDTSHTYDTYDTLAPISETRKDPMPKRRAEPFLKQKEECLPTTMLAVMDIVGSLGNVRSISPFDVQVTDCMQPCL